VRIAVDGTALKPVSAPPAHTLAMIDNPKIAKGEGYAVTFRPYGNGPSNSTAVIAVLASKPAKGSKEHVKLAGRNVLVQLTSKSKVDVGGLYSGTIRLVASGGSHVFVLLEATKK
jgi:hypothetical protein